MGVWRNHSLTLDSPVGPPGNHSLLHHPPYLFCNPRRNSLVRGWAFPSTKPFLQWRCCLLGKVRHGESSLLGGLGFHCILAPSDHPHPQHHRTCQDPHQYLRPPRPFLQPAFHPAGISASHMGSTQQRILRDSFLAILRAEEAPYYDSQSSGSPLPICF